MADPDSITFTISLHGPSLAEHEIAVADLVPLLEATNDLIQEADRQTNGDKTSTSLKVRGSPKAGSFEIDFVAIHRHLEAGQAFLTSHQVQSIANVLALLGIGGLRDVGQNAIALIRWLKAKKITGVRKNGGTSEVTREDGEKKSAPSEAVDLVRNRNIRKSLDEVIAGALQHAGVEKIRMGGKRAGEYVEIPREEGEYFKQPFEMSDEEATVHEMHSRLRVIGISFSEGKKWRFSDGASIFHAGISDSRFQRKIDDHAEAFKKDDELSVTLRITQRRVDGRLKAEYEIIRVHTHTHAPNQLEFDGT